MRSELRLVVIPATWPPIVHVRLQFPSGSIADPPDRPGQTALCWRAALRAAGKRDQATLAKAFDGIGSGVVAHVGRRQTVIEGFTLAAEMETFMGLLADVVLRPRLSKADVDHARTHQIADISALFDDDESLAAESVIRFAHRGQPAGQSPMGTPDALRRIDAAQCKVAHQRFISRVKPHIGFAGAIDEKAAGALLRTHLAPLLGAATQRVNSQMAAPRIKGRRLLLLDHPGRLQASVVVALPTIGARHKDMLALRIADAVIGGAFSSRLNLRIREQRGWTYSLQAGIRAANNTGLWTVSWAPTPDVAAQSIDLAMRVIELARKDGISAAEHGFGQGFLTGGLRYDADTPEAELGLRMTATSLGLGPTWLDTYAAKVQALTRKQVNAALRAHIDPGAAVVVVIGDARKLRPSLAQLKSGFAVQVLPYRAAPNEAVVAGNSVRETPGPSPATVTTPASSGIAKPAAVHK
ncbi:MAG: insulinase family protein [Myxococcales bacterium]|nr:insulinase family protein [Myxococcales bacterium]